MVCYVSIASTPTGILRGSSFKIEPFLQASRVI
jgi:hypothetical protein